MNFFDETKILALLRILKNQLFNMGLKLTSFKLG